MMCCEEEEGDRGEVRVGDELVGRDRCCGGLYLICHILVTPIYTCRHTHTQSCSVIHRHTHTQSCSVIHRHTHTHVMSYTLYTDGEYTHTHTHTHTHIHMLLPSESGRS